MPSTLIRGFTFGRMMRVNRPNSEHPSMRAASRSESGISAMNCRAMNKPNASAQTGIIKPANVLLRFSLENLSVIFSGIVFGPLAGVLVAVTADLVGCVMVGYTVNPLVTLGAAVIGLMSGFAPILLKKYTAISGAGIVIITVVLSHLCGSVIIKTFGLAVFYDMPIFILMLWRLLNYTIVSVAESLILCVLFKREKVIRQIEKIKQESK